MTSELYEKLLSEKNWNNAYIVIKNLFNKNVGDKNVFKEFIDLNLYLAMESKDVEQRKMYANEAIEGLTLFSENTDLNEEILNFINDVQKKINDVCTEIDNDENKLYEEANRIIEEDNEKYLNEIDEKIDELNENISEDEKFESLLLEISKIDEGINKDFLNEEQGIKYGELINKLTEIQNKKMINDNKIAIYRYRGVLKDFKLNEKKYIMYENVYTLKNVILYRLFSMNKYNLFEETSMYYNYVYQYIFSKVDDETKYKMTEWLVESRDLEKK